MLLYIFLYLWTLIAVNHIINLIYLYRGKHDIHKSTESISLIIPCRNEEENLPSLLDSVLSVIDKDGLDIKGQKTSIKEVIIVNDCSTDNTHKIVMDYLPRLKKLCKYIEIKNKPDDWNGKNYACWRGAEIASCKKLLFIDADVRLKNIEKLNFNSKYSLGFIFPEFVCKTIGEKLIVPAKINFWYLFISPMYFMNWNYRWASSTGYFLYVDKKTYFEIGGHEKIKSSNTEDLDLARLMVQNKYKIQVKYLPEVASIKMYENLKEGWAATERNYYRILFNNLIFGLFFWILIFNFLFFPFVMLFTDFKIGISLVILLLIFLNILMFITYQKVKITDFIIGIAGIFLNFIIYMSSFYKVFTKKKFMWKGRELN